MPDLFTDHVLSTYIYEQMRSDIFRELICVYCVVDNVILFYNF